MYRTSDSLCCCDKSPHWSASHNSGKEHQDWLSVQNKVVTLSGEWWKHSNGSLCWTRGWIDDLWNLTNKDKDKLLVDAQVLCHQSQIWTWKTGNILSEATGGSALQHDLQAC